MSGSRLRGELSARGHAFAAANGLAFESTLSRVPSVIFGADARRHGNFHPASYRNICANPAWARRLTKLHPGHKKAWPRSDWRWRELDSANSSDALLMNVFCYRRCVENPSLCAILGIERGVVPEFGFKPRIPLNGGNLDRTEIDMKVGERLVEAKLTESGFQSVPWRRVERYRDFEEVFDKEELPTSGETVRSYQLIRGILAAHVLGGSFCLLCDARRSDLIEAWYSVVRAVKDCSLRCRLQVLTWQELSAALPPALRRFLDQKYGVRPA